MPVTDEPRVYEIRIHGFATCAGALAYQDPIAELLCPIAEHDGPCDVPWEFTVGAPEDETDDEPTVLVLGVYTSRAQAAEVADRVRTLVGETHPVDLAAGDPEQFEALVEQYRIESALPRA